MKEARLSLPMPVTLPVEKIQDPELRGVFERARELYNEFATEYSRCARDGKVSERLNNLFHEVLVKLRSALDMSMVRLWKKFVEPNLSEKERKQIGRAVQFPLHCRQSEFSKDIEKWKILTHDKAGGSRNALPAAVFSLIERVQPFNRDRRHLALLRKWSNLGKHVRLPVSQISYQPVKVQRRANGSLLICSKGTLITDKNGQTSEVEGLDARMALLDVDGANLSFGDQFLTNVVHGACGLVAELSQHF